MPAILLLAALAICCSVPSAFGQAVRVDVPLQTYGPNVPTAGGPQPQALWIANAIVSICTHPSATLGACQSSPITTYTDNTEVTPCPTNAQLVQLPGTTCTAKSGTAGNAGFWYGGGLVDYWVQGPYGTYGPYSTGGPVGGGGGGNPGGSNLQLQFNQAGVFGGTQPTYDPSVSAFNGSNQYSKGSAFGFIPTLPGSENFGQYIANAFLSNTYTQQLPGNQAFTALGVYDLRLDGGVNQFQDGLSFKPGLTPFRVVGVTHTPGSMNPFAVTNYQFSVGDAFNIYSLVYCYGGTSAGGDEGCQSMSEQINQGNADFQGTVTGGAGTGSTAVTISPTQADGTQGGNRYLLNLNPAHLITAGNITALVRTGGQYSTYTGSGTGWPVATVNTTLGTAVAGLPGSYTVTPGSMTGITTSTVLCIADSGNFQTVIPTATTGTTFTATFQKPQLSSAIVSAGGLCGYYVGITADNRSSGGITGTLLTVWPVIRSTSATSMDVWVNHQGAYQNYPGDWNNPLNEGYTLYPGAEVLHVNNGGATLSDTLGLYPNTVAWTNADTLDLPLYPDISMQSGNTVITRFTPPSQGGVFARHFEFGPYFSNGIAGGNSGLFHAENFTANSYYTTAPGHNGPVVIDLSGFWRVGLNMEFAPQAFNQHGAIVFHNDPITGCGFSNVFSAYVGRGSGDQWQYNTCDGSTNFTVGGTNGTQVNVGIGPHGTISTPGEVQAGPGTFGTAQNLLLYSQFPSGTSAPWVHQGSQVLASVTPNAALDPIGNMTAETVVAPAVMGALDSSGQAQTVSGLTNGGFYTQTICFRSHDGLGESMEIGPVGDSAHASVISLTDTNYHCLNSLNGTPVGFTSAAWFWIFVGTGTAGSNAGATVDVAFAQLEPTNFHGQYIPTTSAAVTVTGMVATNAYVASVAGQACIGADATGKLGAGSCGGGGSGLSGMTAGQVPIAATTSTVTSSKALGSAANNIPVLDGSGKLVSSEIPNNAADTTGTASKATNIAGGTLGTMWYQSAADTTGAIAPNTTVTILCLTQQGTGTVGAAPVWGACAGSAATAFSAITGATNTSAAMLCGTGCSLGPTGSGTVNANQINGAAVPLTKTIVGTNGSGQIIDASSASLTNNTSGNAATATALAASPTNCSAGQAPRGINASGTAQNCTTYTQTICSGTIVLNVTAIPLGSTFDNTAACSGLLTTDNVQIDFASNPTAVTGYGVAGNTLTIYKYPAANTIHVVQGNNAGNTGSITPGAMTVNYHVFR